MYDEIKNLPLAQYYRNINKFWDAWHFDIWNFVEKFLQQRKFTKKMKMK